MKRDLFIFYTEQFLTYLRDEKQVSLGTLKSYTSDILQFSHFWDSYEQIKKQQYELKKIVLQYEQWLFSQKLSSSSIARKCSCLASLNRFFIRHKREERILLQRPFVQQKTPLALQQKRINSKIILNALQQMLSSPLTSKSYPTENFYWSREMY